MSGCTLCGGCCEYLASVHDLEYIIDTQGRDGKFIKKHWRYSTYRLRHNRFMPKQVWDKLHHFVCDCFDPKTKLCKDYEHRPDICRRYPVQADNMLTAMSDKCGILVPEVMRVGPNPHSDRIVVHLESDQNKETS